MEVTNTSILRVYFHYGQKARNLSFCPRLWNNNLGQLLLKKAKETGIDQANIFIAKSGCLQNEKIVSDISEIPANKDPAYIELIDQCEKLKSFIKDNKTELTGTNVILLNNECFKIIE